MVLNDRIAAFSELGKFLKQFETIEKQTSNSDLLAQDFFDDMILLIQTSKHHNGWFTEENVSFAIAQWANLLTVPNLEKWISPYNLGNLKSKSIGIIMAGNIPLVGFHDFLCVLIAGHHAKVKLSNSDNQLLPFIAKCLIAIDSRFESKITFIKDRLTDFDAVIATGSNNTSRYFEYYFGKKPNIIRKNRNSVAILTGKETEQELIALGEDVFRYYGLGCRSVSKIFVPKGYNFDTFFKAMYAYQDCMNTAKYANNYDYNKAVYLMSNFKLLENGFLLLKEDQNYASPIACLFYETYSSEAELTTRLQLDSEKIQCIVGAQTSKKQFKFGQTQQPGLGDYADGIDIIEFLSKNI